MPQLDELSIRLFDDVEHGEHVWVWFLSDVDELVKRDGWFEGWDKTNGIDRLILAGRHDAKFKIPVRRISQFRRYV